MQLHPQKTGQKVFRKKRPLLQGVVTGAMGFIRGDDYFFI